MSKVRSWFTGWPVGAWVVSAVLALAVAGLAITTATSQGGTHRVATSGTTTTTSTTTTVPVGGSSTTSTIQTTTTTRPSTTSTTKESAPTTRPGSNVASVVAGPTTSVGTAGGASSRSVTTTVPPTTAPPTTAAPRTTTTTTAVGQNTPYCSARVQYPTPATGTPETVYVASTSPRTPVSLTIYYKTSPPNGTPYPGPGSPGVTTSSTGQAQFTFTVSANSANYPVIVEVNVGHVADECETHFTPSS